MFTDFLTTHVRYKTNEKLYFLDENFSPILHYCQYHFHVISYLIALCNLQIGTAVCGAVAVILSHFPYLFKSLSLFRFTVMNHQS